MNGPAPSSSGGAVWRDAILAAELLAVAPRLLQGACVRAGAGPVRDAFLDACRALAPEAAPFRKLPANVDEARLLGGLDFAATAAAGKPVIARGLLADSNDGFLFIPMAERLRPDSAAHLAAAIDTGVVALERDGVSARHAARFAFVLGDEGAGLEEYAPLKLVDRAAFVIDLSEVSVGDAAAFDLDPARVEDARARLPATRIDDAMISKAARIAEQAGVSSARSLAFVVGAAKAAAALAGRANVVEADLALACRLVLAPRSTEPPPQEEASSDSPPPPPPESQSQTEGGETQLRDQEIIEEAVRSGAVSAYLNEIARRLAAARAAAPLGASGARAAGGRGRPLRPRKGDPRRDGRLDVAATLAAAAPFQRLRTRRRDAISIRYDDFRVRPSERRTESIVVFVVDASGSAAMNRMAEAKGAIELLLADCYSRRDHVALVSFRRDEAELILPPTRSLVRARRVLSAVAAGGGTPLASGLVMARATAATEMARGRAPLIVILSDGRGNIALDGAPGDAAETDAQKAADALRAFGAPILYFDTSVRPSARARALSERLGARYAPLPYADRTVISAAVKASMPG